MNKFRKLNLITGWIVFAIAAFTYLSTIEPTVSLWDCGEFIASAYKLEVGHPPGAPLFMIMARLATLLTSDPANAAKMINSLSALASAFTILFLFWSITHIARKLVYNLYYVEKITPTDKKVFGITVYKKEYKDDINNINFTLTQTLLILGSGVIGSLAYTFSDTFWFSAVEAEVYALSSLFTAVVFWAILKWENIADQPHSNRWIILIAYLMGLSIGVHLLNLLAIPAMVFVYYFKRYTPDTKGVLAALGMALLLLAVVMYGIISGVVVLSSKFELLFVNGLGLPFNSGVLFYIILILGLVIAGIIYSHKKNKPVLNTIILSFAVILIGYSSFAMTVIRSAANPPMDENNPENVFALLQYLNREQYGDHPLVYGQYYNAPVIESHKQYTYAKEGNKYVKVAKTNPKYVYDPAFETIFPRMYSSDRNHIQAYKSWATIKTPDNEKPSFADNIEFFVKYQVGFMYFRYFFWNFVGRQNNIQGHGGFRHGNWISGIEFIDKLIVGPSDKLPDFDKNNPARNKFYFLPLLLGILGMMISFSGNQKDFWVIMLLFILTGIAIVVYLNQTPYQPRERDYAYAGSFYAFAIWIGLSVIAIYEALRKKIKEKAAVAVALLITIVVPIQMAAETWDDHDRSDRYTARDFSLNYLESCAKNAILFSYGDNDTFPLWYDQEVEGIRTDVRVVNLSLLGTDWYIDQMRRKAYDSDPVPFNMPPEKYAKSKRNIIPVYDRKDFFVEEKYNAGKQIFDPEYEILYNEFMDIAAKSNFPEKFEKDYKTLQKGYSTIPFTQFVALVNTILENNAKRNLNFDENRLKNLKKRTDELLNKVGDYYVPLEAAMAFIESDNPATKIRPGTEDELDFLPANKFIIKVNKENAVKYGIVSAKDTANMVSEIKFKISKKYLLKNDMMVLDLLSKYDWTRPIYFGISIGEENYMGLQDYFQLDGFAYRLVPIFTPKTQEIGRIDTDILYDNIMNKFKWGNMEKDNVLVDNYVLRQIRLMDIRGVFARLAEALLKEGKKDKAENVLDKVVEITPANKVAYDYKMLDIVDLYYALGNKEKAAKIAKKTAEYNQQILEYYVSLPDRFRKEMDRESSIALSVIGSLINSAQINNDKETADYLVAIYKIYAAE